MAAETFGAARRTKKLNPMWGASIGAGLSSVTAVGLRQMNAAKHPKLVSYSEGIGFVAGALPGVAMLLLQKGKNKDAGYAAILSSFLSSGLRQIEMLAFPEKVAMAGMANAALRGKSVAPALPAPAAAEGGMGDAVIEPTDVFQGNGLGIVDIEPTTALQGYSESDTDMPQLVGASLNAANEHVQLVGGPPLSQHASHWGATLFAR